MKLDRFLRIVAAFGILLVLLGGLAGILFISEKALSVWDRLLEGPALLRYLFLAFIALLVAAAAWLIWVLLVRRLPQGPRTAGGKHLTREAIEARLRDAEAAGVGVAAARAELAKLAEKHTTGAIELCFFGEISSGKSSLIKALVPDAVVEISALGGSTTEIRHYRWQGAEQTEVVLTDVPGTGGHVPGFDVLALEEARRAHVVLFVCDGDLTRSEKVLLEKLLGVDKPVVIVLNKSDRFDVEERSALMQRLLEHLDDLGGVLDRDRVVAVSAGGAEDVVERWQDGAETVTTRRRPADVSVLIVAINRLLGASASDLDIRRQRAVFHLAAEKLEAAEAEFRDQRAEQIIRSATRRAVIGALAAVSPGTDVLIQGYIGTAMTRELCALYATAPRDLDIEEFLNLSQSRLGRALPLALAVAGNGLKAFPGIGTVAGGLAHAVAYGLIFDALGRSLVMTLKQHGQLLPERAAKEFEEGVNGYIEAGVGRIARMALEARPRRD